MAKRIVRHLLPAAEYLGYFDFRPETGEVFRKKRTHGNCGHVGEPADRLAVSGYKVLNYKGQTHPVHRLMFHIFGKVALTSDVEVDHINRGRADNRLANLRPVSRSQNMQNVGKPSNNTSGDLGVNLQVRNFGSRFRAYVEVGTKRITKSFPSTSTANTRPESLRSSGGPKWSRCITPTPQLPLPKI